MKTEPYKIFVSHTEVDSPIASAVRRVLAKAFSGYVYLHLALEDNEIGISWKEDLQVRLNNFDALITIMTPEAVEKPWIYVEWSPFWISNKDFYVLTHGEIANEKLFGPMNDRQTGKILDREDIVSLFRQLHRACGANTSGKQPPFGFVDEFLTEVIRGIEEKLMHKYGIYRRTLETLPPSDQEKRKIAEYFYRVREYDVFLGIVKRIRSDTYKSDIARSIMTDGETDPKEELELAAKIAAYIDSSDEIRCLAVCLVDRGAIDTPEMHQIVQILAAQNRTEIRRLCQYLIEKGADDTRLFDDMLQILAQDSPVELRNLGYYMIRNSFTARPSFGIIVETIIGQEKYIHIRELATEMCKHNIHTRDAYFIQLVDTLFASGREKQIIPFFDRFIEMDLEYAKVMLLRQSTNRSLVEELLTKFESLH